MKLECCPRSGIGVHVALGTPISIDRNMHQRRQLEFFNSCEPGINSSQSHDDSQFGAPTATTDGTTMTPLPAHRAFCGTSVIALTKSVAVCGGTATRYEITGLTVETGNYLRIPTIASHMLQRTPLKAYDIIAAIARKPILYNSYLRIKNPFRFCSQ
jgi:hypothetical protein